MNAPDSDYDPDDNFGHGADGHLEWDQDEEGVEALVWQLLLAINPGDEETALRQFDAYREAAAEAGDEAEPIELVRDVIDWVSGFQVQVDDSATLIDAINELASRWNLRIDWGVDEPDDPAFLAATDVPALLAVAYDRLREYGYTVWTWNADDDIRAGWITLSRDDEAIRLLGPALGFEVRLASDTA